MLTFRNKLLVDSMGLVIDVDVARHCILSYFRESIHKNMFVPCFFLVADFAECVFDLDENEGILGHHTHSLSLH